ncbi:hypothetical protein PybrP1_011087 [[Pythium] brassicae (nom. inval.)]|nr:hypothetical protein PybrP1_011087 [[Pythium] brassicae (nom. inval.)]
MGQEERAGMATATAKSTPPAALAYREAPSDATGEKDEPATDVSTRSSSGGSMSPASHPDDELATGELTPEDALVQRRASAGLAVAQRFVSARELVEQARIALYVERAEARALETLRRAVTLWRQLAIDQRLLNALLRVAGERMASSSTAPDSADAFFALALAEDSEVFWRQCVAAFPAVAVFQYWLARRLAERDKNADALLFVDKALALEWNPQWLYLRAQCLGKLAAASRHQRVDAFQCYVARNPPDEEHVPEAYYALALLALEQGEYARAKRYQALAQQAERPPVRFPRFGLVDDAFEPKRLLRVAFSRPLLLLSADEQRACIDAAELACECCAERVPLLALLQHKLWDCSKRHVGCLLCGVAMAPEMLFPHQELAHSPS